jgi:hypothetical protein
MVIALVLIKVSIYLIERNLVTLDESSYPEYTKDPMKSLHVIAAALFSSMVFTLGCSSSGGNGVNNPRNPYGAGPAAVNLSSNGGVIDPTDAGSAGNYVILAKTGVSNVPGSAITGNVGVSPVAQSYITGFSLVNDSSNVFATSSQVVGGGKVYAADNAVPTPSNMTTAIGSMETAYVDAAGRTNPDYNELAAGLIGGLTLAPGLYKWSSSVSIPTDVTLSGGSNDVWIFQIAGNLLMSSAMNVTLAGGAQARNIYWQVAGQVTLGTTTHFQGIILAKTAVNLQTGAVMVGQIFSQTAVSLDHSTLTKP